ncbi:MAG: ankyrin repeat domain-containing protein [Fibromonadaceae bacterium]|nr:ankyrin repeat domain-containing protein [Fibromonadaceae bacterium]
MLKRLIIIGLCAMAFMACGKEQLDPTNPESIRRHFARMEPPVQVNIDQFVALALKGDTANMTLFLRASNNDYLNQQNARGNTALATVVNRRNEVVVKYLLDRDAEIGIKSSQLGLTALEDAATREDTTDYGVFRMLVEAQKRKDPELRSIGASLHLASRFGALRNVQLLVENGANPNAKSLEGLTPLHEASKEGRRLVVEYLISKKVEINPLDRDGYTPMDWSAALGEGSTFPEVTRVLRRAGGRHTDAWRRAM